MAYKVLAHIHSLNGDMREVIILSKEENDYIVQYKNTKCRAIFNVFTNEYYVDDLYSIIKD